MLKFDSKPLYANSNSDFSRTALNRAQDSKINSRAKRKPKPHFSKIRVASLLIIVMMLFSFLWVSPSTITNSHNFFQQIAYAQSTGVGGGSTASGSLTIPEYTQQLPFEGEIRRINGQVVDGVTNEPIRDWNAKLYSIDDSGYRTWIMDLSNISEVMDFDLTKSETGQYQVDVSSVNSSSGSEQFGQTLFTIAPDAPDVVDIGAIKLYGQTVFVGGTNGVSTSPSEAAPGSSVTVRIQYNNTSNREINRGTLLLEVPNGTQIVERSITLNGKGVNASTVNPPYYQLSLNDNDTYNGVVTYKIRLNDDNINFNVSGLDISARIRYTIASNESNATNYGQSNEEVIGTAHVVIPQVSIVAPASLAALNTTLTGVGPVGNMVTVYDSNETLGQAQVSNGGLWRLDVSLPDLGSPSIHLLRAEVQTESGALLKSQSSVVYNSEEPKLQRVCMGQSGGQSVCYEPSKGVASFSYRLNNNPISFELYFDEPNSVSNVNVTIAGPGGDYAEASLSDDGIYRTNIIPDISEVLGPIYVGYSIKSEVE